jgi:hypothetical protein
MAAPSVVLTGRRLLGRFLLDTCVVLDRAVVRDDTGGSTATWVARPTPLACRWGRPTDAEATVVGGVLEGKATAALSLPYGTTIAEGARVENPAEPADRQWEVYANLTPASVMATQVRVLVREV